MPQSQAWGNIYEMLGLGPYEFLVCSLLIPHWFFFGSFLFPCLFLIGLGLALCWALFLACFWLVSSLILARCLRGRSLICRVRFWLVSGLFLARFWVWLGLGWVWLGLAGSGWVWLGLAGCGWVWLGPGLSHACFGLVSSLFLCGRQRPWVILDSLPVENVPTKQGMLPQRRECPT